MNKHVGLRVALIIAAAGTIALMAAGKSWGGSGTMEARRMALLSLSGVFIPLLASAVLAGILAAKLNRSPGGWAVGTIFLPFIIPLVLVFLPPTASPARRVAVPVVASGAADGEAPFNEQGFCMNCVRETTEESPGNVSTLNGIGTALMGTWWSFKGLDPCPVCGSVIQSKWITFGFGVKKLGTYRILYTKQGIMGSKYYGRRLISDFPS